MLLYFQNQNAARVTGQDGPLCVSTSQNTHPTGTCLGIPPFHIFLFQSPSYARLLTHTFVTASGASNSSQDPFKPTFLILRVVSSHSGCVSQTPRLLMTNILHYSHSPLPQTTPNLLSCITSILPISRPTSLPYSQLCSRLNSLYLSSQALTFSTPKSPLLISYFCTLLQGLAIHHQVSQPLIAAVPPVPGPFNS